MNPSGISAILLTGLIFMGSCKSGEQNTLSIGDPHFIEGIELGSPPASEECFLNEEMGITSIKVLDSLIIVGHSDCWSIYDKTDKTHIGNFLSAGDGPQEFLYVPVCSNALFTIDNDSLCAFIPDTDHQRIVRMNLEKCKERHPDYLSTYMSSAYMTNRSWDAVPCTPESYLLSQPHHDMRGFNRLLIDADEEYRFRATQGIDSISVGDESTINILARVTRYNAAADRFVEAMIYLNQINIFSRDGNKGKTICIGDRLDNIQEKEKKFFTGDRRTEYTTVSAWPCGFGAVYSGITELQRMESHDIQSELQFFDWDGSPLYRCLLPGYVTAFDIDFDEKILYVVSEQDDVLKAYDATVIIEKLISQ